jgi:integrase
MAARGGWGEGTLTPLGNGKWKLRLPPYLGRGHKTFRADSKTQARKEQRRILDETYAALYNPTPDRPTFDEACDWLLDNHAGDRNTVKRLQLSLKRARDEFGKTPVDAITYGVLTEWRKTLLKDNLSPTTVHGYTQAVKQALNSCVRRGLIKESPALHLANPLPGVGQISPFERMDEVEAVAKELPAAYQALPVFACRSGLRPEEWLALERGDIRDGWIYVNKRFVDGMLKQGTKNGDPERRVPLDPLADAALKRQPSRIDTRLLFPGEGGGYLILSNFRPDVWKPAFTAAGIEERRLKDMRHTYASWQLYGNCNVWHLSKMMGTAVHQIERTYGRWIPGSEQVVLAAMAAFDAKQAATQ